jgi:hypothetical protein
MPASALRTAFPASNLIRETHGGRADQGLALIAWPTVDFYSDPKRARTLSVLASVLQLRLLDEIREKQGTTYSPTAAHNASQVFPGYGFIAAQIEAPPEKLDGFLADSARIAADLRDTPVGADELERARKPMVETMLRQQASNGWWLQALADVQSKPGAAAAIASALDQLSRPSLRRTSKRRPGTIWSMRRRGSWKCCPRRRRRGTEISAAGPALFLDEGGALGPCRRSGRGVGLEIGRPQHPGRGARTRAGELAQGEG